MDNVIEPHEAPRSSVGAAPALAVQFFLIPLAVVAVTVLVYGGFRTLLSDRRDAQDYLNEIRFGGSNRRWPAAYELSRLMADPRVRAQDPTLAPALVQAFKASKGDDPRVRQYLALALGRLDRPVPPETLALLSDAIDDPDPETRIDAIWALASIGDPAAVPRLRGLYASPDPGVRKMVVYALGALPGDAQLPILRAALADPLDDIQWNAAVALARHGSEAGIQVLARMLDRSYVERTVTRAARPGQDVDPVADVMIGGLRAVAALKAATLREPVTALSRTDPSLRVRQAAIETLNAF